MIQQNMKPKILVIDNYDSFTYNLVHLLQELGHQPTVWRNDKFELDEVESFDYLLLSPGPGLPCDAGHLMDVIRRYGARKSILGVCLGMQAIAEVYGGHLYNLEQPFHGVATPIVVKDELDPLFRGVPSPFPVGRYHSWSVSTENLPEDLSVTAEDMSGVIMALRHKTHPVTGVQFHPESVLTVHGRKLIENWLNSHMI